MKYIKDLPLGDTNNSPFALLQVCHLISKQKFMEIELDSADWQALQELLF